MNSNTTDFTGTTIRPGADISLLRYVVIIIPAAFLFSRFAQADGVWWAFPFAELLTAVFSYYIYHKKTRVPSEA